MSVKPGQTAQRDHHMYKPTLINNSWPHEQQYSLISSFVFHMLHTLTIPIILNQMCLTLVELSNLMA